MRDKGKDLWAKGRKISSPFALRPSPSPRGFSLIESLIATAIVGIGFVGVYSMVVLSEQFIKWSIARQKLQLYANQMFEVIEGDVANVANYNGLAIAVCVNPGVGASTALTRGYEWCTRMQNEFGAAGAANVRTITVTNAGNKYTVLIQLEAYAAKAQIIVERTYAL